MKQCLNRSTKAVYAPIKFFTRFAHKKKDFYKA